MRTSLRPQHYKKRPSRTWAHPHIQGAYYDYEWHTLAKFGSSPHTGSIHFLTRGDTHKQLEKYSVSLFIEMSTQFLRYGGHALIGFGS